MKIALHIILENNVHYALRYLVYEINLYLNSISIVVFKRSTNLHKNPEFAINNNLIHYTNLKSNLFKKYEFAINNNLIHYISLKSNLFKSNLFKKYEFAINNNLIQSW